VYRYIRRIDNWKSNSNAQQEQRQIHIGDDNKKGKSNSKDLAGRWLCIPPIAKARWMGHPFRFAAGEKDNRNYNCNGRSPGREAQGHMVRLI